MRSSVQCLNDIAPKIAPTHAKAVILKGVLFQHVKPVTEGVACIHVLTYMYIHAHIHTDPQAPH